MFFRVLAVFACLIVSLSLAAVPGDKILSLPGFPGPFPSDQYSGYIEVDAKNGRYLHYWLVLSENNPATDPVVLWMNGGPGCSSLDGFFYEQGPLHFADNQRTTDGVPSLVLNPSRWNLMANMLFVEAPAGVGFSYSNTPSDYNTNDNKTAHDNYLFLQGFFSLYPEYAQNPFFVSGESYAGIYVPTLVEQIMIHNGAGDSNINLIGFMVGNGCTGNSIGACSDYGTQIRAEFLFGHGLYSPGVHAALESACTDWINPSDQCLQYLNEMSDQIGDVNIYDIYDVCINGNNNASAPLRKIPPVRHAGVAKALGRLGGPDECIDGIDAGAYLNDASVRQAIHVVNFTIVPQWTICTDNINYDGNIDSLMSLYPTLIKRYRTLIYNGDVDCCVPYTDNEQWTSSFGYAIQEDWRPWLVNDQVAGYVTTYQQNDFTFATIKGAGHMVPQYKPVEALAMFQRFLSGQPL
jgi:carboxypeptidase C (cathepsin A)